MAALVGVVAFVTFRSRLDEPSSATTAGPAFVGGDLHSLVVDPTNSSRVFVGGHQGVAVSNDGGATWTQIDSLEGADAMGWAFTSDAVIVGGHPGLFRSTDGATTFEQDNSGLPGTDIHALGAGGGVIYAYSPAVGVFASTDGGETWEVRSAQAAPSFMGRILVDPEDPERLIAPAAQFGALESTDGGRTWKQLGGLGSALWVSSDPETKNHVVVSTAGEAAETRDGGRTWRAITVPEGASMVELVPSDPQVMFAAVHEGTDAVVWVSRDGGATWERP